MVLYEGIFEEGYAERKAKEQAMQRRPTMMEIQQARAARYKTAQQAYSAERARLRLQRERYAELEYQQKYNKLKRQIREERVKEVKQNFGELAKGAKAGFGAAKAGYKDIKARAERSKGVGGVKAKARAFLTGSIYK